MTESASNESAAEVFARIGQMAGDRGVAVKRTLTRSSLKLEFADGQRIIVNHDERTHKIWLAARSGGLEYDFNGALWISALDGSELFARLAELFDQIIASNPVNTQPGKLVEINPIPAPSYVSYQHEPGSSPVKKIVFAGILAWAGYIGFQHFIGSPSNVESARFPTDNSTLLARSQCDELMPANGTTHVFPASTLQLDSPSNTEITLQNDHAHAFMATFTAPRTVIPYLSVLVNAGQTAKVGLPYGQYDMLFSVGDSWCNSSIGFADGDNTKLNTTLNVVPLQPMQILAQSSGSGTSDMQLFIRSSVAQAEPPAFKFIGNGVMEIPRHSNGHYHITGAINGFPVTYLIDTGASLTSLSAQTAKQAGIRDCKPTTFRTAGGTTPGCVALVPELTIGTFQLHNVAVAVLPNMEVDLLGMNILSHFEMKQIDGVMRLSYR